MTIRLKTFRVRALLLATTCVITAIAAAAAEIVSLESLRIRAIFLAAACVLAAAAAPAAEPA